VKWLTSYATRRRRKGRRQGWVAAGRVSWFPVRSATGSVCCVTVTMAAGGVSGWSDAWVRTEPPAACAEPEPLAATCGGSLASPGPSDHYRPDCAARARHSHVLVPNASLLLSCGFAPRACWLCWLLGTSVREIRDMRQPPLSLSSSRYHEEMHLPRNMRTGQANV
jgi:hypothetical protein